jgi:hypothetical protein
MVCAAESARSKSKSLKSNITRKESMALKSLKDNKEIIILQADKGNCIVGEDTQSTTVKGL